MDSYRSKTRHTGYTTYTRSCEVLQGTLLCVFHAWKPVKWLDDKIPHLPICHILNSCLLKIKPSSWFRVSFSALRADHFLVKPARLCFYQSPCVSSFGLQEGMGHLQVHPDGVKLEEGESEFLHPIYAQDIHSREVRSCHSFSCSSSHILFHSVNRLFFLPTPPVLSSSRLPCALSRGHYLISFFAKLDCDLELSSLHVLLSSKSNSLQTLEQFVSSCSVRAAYFWLWLFLGGRRRCVGANWIWQSLTVHVVVQWVPH